MAERPRAFPPAALETARLRLRRPRLDDAEALFERYSTDPQVTRYMTWRPHGCVSDTLTFLRSVRTAWDTGVGHRAWVIERLAGGGPVGMIGATREGHRVELGYTLARPYWGRGLVTEAARAVVDAALADPGVFRVSAVCDVDNAASARVMEKVGMRYEGVLRRWLVHPNLSSEPRDCKVYARVRGDVG